MRTLRLALVVNPIAGIGGPAGLIGSDGEEIQDLAIARGFRSRAQDRAAEFLRVLERAAPGAEVAIVGEGPLGFDVLSAGGDRVETVPRVSAESRTSPADTRAVVAAAIAANVDVIVFVGGDGTARDILDELGETGTVPVLGIPSGVKMHSAVFSRSPATAAALLASWEPDRDGCLRVEVADIDESARRSGIVTTRLYGTLPVPNRPRQLQGGKLGSSAPGSDSAAGLARALEESLDPEAVWVLGPGSTVRHVWDHLAEGALSDKESHSLSLLAVDISLPAGDGRVLKPGADAKEIEEATAGRRVQLVLSPVGGQGFLIGRGNQQLRPELLEHLGQKDLIVLATATKLGQLNGGPLYIDSGRRSVDEALTGYIRVLTGPGQTAMMRLEAG